MDCVARSTVCPRWEEELIGGAIVEDRRWGYVAFVCDVGLGGPYYEVIICNRS